MSIYDYAISNSERKETILARRLLDGVIKPEAIARSTLSRQKSKIQGRNPAGAKPCILHVGDVRAIKTFARGWAEKYKEEGWTTQSVDKVTQSLRTRVNKVKQSLKKDQHSAA
ncbi:hypothetical protein HCN44_007211 [Aphidius gifuensis]|uniref:Uncharacterized protein n=1 Tax=Aphidius gifuensis TaxID=684658 RepID=A0A834XLF9_APHGI|nr:hypothetical protein HCN44_007211 [Aphidius gifuensis]